MSEKEVVKPKQFSVANMLTQLLIASLLGFVVGAFVGVVATVSALIAKGVKLP